ncbi:MAG: 16S rRNA (guanine(527)-N(7))-methyltransferase RsmG [Bacteroidetes bacterium]|nr:16S rRNA (guanine(527)-N(7))-methyltransferase RsmG [Bacteroidota bacterium]MDA1121209.1 16S rRNA (guanine(527)-N(7))-methyltransferase RsmG [Bacteroidota bacterium]
MPGIDIILKYFPDLSEKQVEQMVQFGDRLIEWNVKINLISRQDTSHFYERHVLHSLAISKLVDFKAGTEILDAGTGGGLPGIPLAILFPESEFHLVDSIGKKIAVVNDIARGLGLLNVQGETKRVEDIKRKYDFVASRAVTRMNRFIPWVIDKINSKSKNEMYNGILAFKGGDLSEELKEMKRPYQLTEISTFFDEAFFSTKKLVYIPL